MGAPQLRQQVLPPGPPWIASGVVGVLAAVGLSTLHSHTRPPWSVLLEPWACVAHGLTVILVLGLLFDIARQRGWRSQLEQLGLDSGKTNWAAAAVAQSLAQFSEIPQPDQVRLMFAKCSDQWGARMEFRSNLYLALAFLVGLPLQILALQGIATAEKPLEALREAAVPLAVGGLEVLAVALPAFLLQRLWRDLFASWRWRVSAEDTYRRYNPVPTAHATVAGARTPPDATHGGAAPRKTSDPGTNRVAGSIHDVSRNRVATDHAPPSTIDQSDATSAIRPPVTDSKSFVAPIYPDDDELAPAR